MRNKLSIFHKSHNIEIKDSSLSVKIDASKQGNFDRLLDEVAPNAILNAGGRADEVRCYPGTREEVIGKVEKWMNGKGRQIMWLSGPAGAGKSAICQTVAERCREHGLHAANFFFFRGDRTRNHVQPLVATLVYQLLPLYPVLHEPLTDCLTVKPLICKASIEEQFTHLISSPFQLVQHSSSVHQPLIFIIDGLDECDDERQQEHILEALHALVKENTSFLILVASRVEPHLVMSFNKITTPIESIFLDGEYRPRADIRRFVVAKFDEIKKTHHLAHTLGKNWPPKADIDAITDKSSGQFIYAATVMRFIQYSSASPSLSLLTVHGMRPSPSHSPLAPLDAVYSYIFSKAQDLPAVKLILGAHFIMTKNLVNEFQQLLCRLGCTAIVLQSLFADLAAVVQVEPGPPMKLIFYHASLSDYLQDKSRSGIYHVDEGDIAVELSTICLKTFHDTASLHITIQVLWHVTKATVELSRSLLDASTRQLEFDKNFDDKAYWNDLILPIERLYFEQDRPLFKVILRSWVRFKYLNYPSIRFEATYGELKSTSANWYYRWYLITEKVKFALRKRS